MKRFFLKVVSFTAGFVLSGVAHTFEIIGLRSVSNDLLLGKKIFDDTIQYWSQ